MIVPPPKRAVATPALWAPEESVRSANSCRNTPNDSVFNHISKKSKGLPETSFGAFPPSYSGVEPLRNLPLKPPAVPFAHREPGKRPKQSQSFTPTPRPAQTQPGVLKDNVQQKWKGAMAVGRAGSASSLAKSCVSDVSPMTRNEEGTSSARQFDKERVHVPSFYVPAPPSSPSVKGVQIGTEDNQNRGQGWNANAGLHSVQPQNTSSYGRPSKRVWPASGMYTGPSEEDDDEEFVGRSQGGYVPPEENQRTGTCSFVQSTWEPTTACRCVSTLSKQAETEMELISCICSHMRTCIYFGLLIKSKVLSMIDMFNPTQPRQSLEIESLIDFTCGYWAGRGKKRTPKRSYRQPSPNNLCWMQAKVYFRYSKHSTPLELLLVKQHGNTEKKVTKNIAGRKHG